jgi:hypothetical protein
MAQSDISFFVDDAAVTFRAAEVPDADFNSGMFGGASNSPGIGISTENPDLDESLPSWTLLDQFGNARNAQIGQCIGGPGFVNRASVDWPSSGGQAGTLPDSTIRLMPVADLPTNAEKDLFADSPDPTKLDGSLTLPADGASLVDLDVGWAAQV